MLPRVPNPIPSAADLARYAEPALTVGTGLLAEPVAGWAGLMSGDPSKVEKVHHALTYLPRTESGTEGLHGFNQFLSGAGQRVMDAPYLGAAVRNFGESADKLGAYSPALGAALRTAPAMVALGVAPEARAAMKNVGGEIGSTIASGGNMGRGPIQMQAGAIKPAVLMQPFRFSKATTAKGSTAITAGERTAERLGKGLESTHKAYATEKTTEDKGHGRNLFAH